MIRTSTLGRLGEWYMASAPTSESEWAPLPEQPVLPPPPPVMLEDGLLSSNPYFNGTPSVSTGADTEKAVISDQRDDGQSTYDFWFGQGKKTGNVIKDVIGGGSSYTPYVPPSSGPSIGMMALIGLGAVAVLGVGAVLLMD